MRTPVIPPGKPWRSAGRDKTVFVGANDGMLHAFNADTGAGALGLRTDAGHAQHVLAGRSAYASNHHNYVNGRLVWSDVCLTNCTDPATADWHTILMGGLGGGGRGYFALDVTDPASPQVAVGIHGRRRRPPGHGYSFGNPLAVKKADGTWVVAVASGYDNGNEGH